MALLPEDFDFNSLELTEIGQWPAVIKFGAVVLVCLIAFGAGYWFDMREQYDVLERVNRAQIEHKKNFEKKQQQASNLPAYLAQKKAVEEALSRFLKLLPEKTEVPELVEAMSQHGMETGLEFRSIRLRPEIVREFYVELPMEINIVASYHDLAGFVTEIARLPRLVTMHDFTLSVLTDHEQSEFKKPADGSSLRMVLTAKTYRYQPLGEKP